MHATQDGGGDGNDASVDGFYSSFSGLKGPPDVADSADGTCQGEDAQHDVACHTAALGLNAPRAGSDSSSAEGCNDRARNPREDDDTGGEGGPIHVGGDRSTSSSGAPSLDACEAGNGGLSLSPPGAGHQGGNNSGDAHEVEESSFVSLIDCDMVSNSSRGGGLRAWEGGASEISGGQHASEEDDDVVGTCSHEGSSHDEIGDDAREIVEKESDEMGFPDRGRRWLRGGWW